MEFLLRFSNGSEGMVLIKPRDHSLKWSQLGRARLYREPLANQGVFRVK
jgi:hypothetical protein